MTVRIVVAVTSTDSVTTMDVISTDFVTTSLGVFDVSATLGTSSVILEYTTLPQTLGVVVEVRHLTNDSEWGIRYFIITVIQMWMSVPLQMVAVITTATIQKLPSTAAVMMAMSCLLTT